MSNPSREPILEQCQSEARTDSSAIRAGNRFLNISYPSPEPILEDFQSEPGTDSLANHVVGGSTVFRIHRRQLGQGGRVSKLSPSGPVKSEPRTNSTRFNNPGPEKLGKPSLHNGKPSLHTGSARKLILCIGTCARCQGGPLAERL